MLSCSARSPDFYQTLLLFRSENPTGVSNEQRKKDSEVKERKGGKKKGSLEGNDAIQDKTENTFRPLYTIRFVAYNSYSAVWKRALM